MAFGKMFEGAIMLHSVPLSAHLVKAMVDRVLDGSVIVFMPIDEVTNITKTLQTFIVWPRHLVSPISGNTTSLWVARILGKEESLYNHKSWGMEDFKPWGIKTPTKQEIINKNELDNGLRKDDWATRFIGSMPSIKYKKYEVIHVGVCAAV
ncbi:unnamed protein product [Sphenostylis stenocarpa]|uniref:DUF8039 domain-containing protein n=1 Tax=Sphenostylis stenocarpa TaxID=92480 RepID=A0AA86VLT9_9FABA|nr:unnamed protein product [Sphenostylis stenocarpa]